MGELRILGPQGDTTVRWNPADPKDVADIRRRFDEIVAQGYFVFELDPATREGTQVKHFSPELRDLRAFRPMVGG